MHISSAIDQLLFSLDFAHKWVLVASAGMEVHWWSFGGGHLSFEVRHAIVHLVSISACNLELGRDGRSRFFL